MDDSIIKQWLIGCSQQAEAGGHIWPVYAACEAGLESGCGTSLLARKANNLFGHKASVQNPYGELNLPTKEYLNGEYINQIAHWTSYPTIKECFTDRMGTLKRLAGGYPHYLQALNAKTGDEFVQEVSKTWSTDPHRADKVLEIYNEFFGGQNVG